MGDEMSVVVTPDGRGDWRVRCSCGCLDVPGVVEAEVGMLIRIHFTASHDGPIPGVGT